MVKKSIILLFTIILLQLIVIVYYMHIRTSLFVDEVWSYGMANSYDSAFLYPNAFMRDKGKVLYNHWVDGRKFFEYITVQPKERFAYDKVYRNQMEDLHPPLYYYILHTICSFFPNRFSRWYGQSINLIVFIFCQVVFFRIALKLFDFDWKKSLLVCCFFGFSIAAVNTFIYIRMYNLVTLWQLLLFFILLDICKSNKISFKSGFFLFTIGVFGFLTHNYFSIFYFSSAIAFSVFFLSKRNYKLFIYFLSIAILSFLTYYLYFPGLFQQASKIKVLMKDVGIIGPFPLKTLLANLSMIINYTLGLDASELINYSKIIIEIIGSNFRFLPVWLFIIIISVIQFFICYRKIEYYNWIVLFQTVLIYITIISSYTFLYRNAVFLGRFLFSILPFFSLIFFFIIDKVLTIIKQEKVRRILYLLTIFIFVLATHYASASEWIFREPPDREEVALSYKNASLIYVCDREETMPDPIIHGKCLDFMYTKKVFVTRINEPEIILKEVNSRDPNDINLILLPANDEGKKIFNSIKNLLGYEPVYCFTDVTNVCVFYVLKL